MDDGISARGDRRIEMKPVEGRLVAGSGCRVVEPTPRVHELPERWRRADAISWQDGKVCKSASVCALELEDSLKQMTSPEQWAKSIDVAVADATEQLRAELEATRGQRDGFRVKYDQLYVAYDNLRERADSAIVENGKLRTEIEEVRKHARQVESMLAERGRQCEELRKANSELVAAISKHIEGGAPFAAEVAEEMRRSIAERRWPWGSEHLAKVAVRHRRAGQSSLTPGTIQALLEAVRLFTGEVATVINDRGTWEAKLGEGPRAVEHRAESAERAVFGLLVITKP